MLPANCEKRECLIGPLAPLAGTPADPHTGFRQPQRTAGAGAGRRPVRVRGQNRRVELARVGWIMTVFACLVAVLILLLQGYYGYALVTFAVAVSAAFNLT